MRNPISRFILRAMLLALFALGGFASGSWLAIRQRRDALLTAFPSAPSPSRSPRLIAETEGPFRTEEEAFTAVFSAHSEPDRLRRGFELSEALERLDAAQCGALVARAAKLRREECLDLIGSLLVRWNELDPESTRVWIQPYVERAFATRRWGLDENVLLAWARADPERALAEALKSPRRASSRFLAIGAAQALAGENPAAQIAQLAALPAGPLREQVLAEGLQEWAKKDAASAYAQLSRLAPGPDLNRTRTGILMTWASKDPEAALVQLRALLPDLPPGFSGAELLDRIVLYAGRKDPRLALEWAVDLPESSRSDATTAALMAWASKKPIAALDWARAHGVPLDARTQGGIEDSEFDHEGGLLAAAVSDDSEEVLAWLRKLPADEDRGRLLAEAIRAQPNETGRALLGELPLAEQIATVRALEDSFGSGDPDESLSWAQSLPRGAVREEAIAAVIASSAERFPEGIESMIEKLASGPDRDAALCGYVRAQYQDPSKGLEIAARISDRGMREQAFRIIANNWFYRDTSAAEAWLASTPELTPETKAALLRSRDEWRADYGN